MTQMSSDFNHVNFVKILFKINEVDKDISTEFVKVYLLSFLLLFMQ